MSRRLCFAVLVVVLWPAAAAAVTPELERIVGERRAAIATYAREEAKCAERFSVNACRDDVRARRREALSRLREQEIQLHERERRERAAARLQSIERRRVEAQTRPPPVNRAVASAPAAATAPASGGVRASQPLLRHRTRETEAAERAAAAEQRREEAAQDRARIQSRIEQRAAEGKKAPAPLPRPPGTAQP